MTEPPTYVPTSEVFANDDQVESLKKLGEYWKSKRERITKENRKRSITLILNALINFSAIILMFFNYLDYRFVLGIIITMLIISLSINRIVHLRIMKLLDERFKP